MIQNAFVFLISTIINILTFVLLLRFFMQLFKASFNNPLAQMAMALTDFIVKPTRRVIPSWKKLDLSTLILAFIAQYLLQLSLKLLGSFVITSPVFFAYIALIALFAIVRHSLDIFFYAILLQAILSWVNPNTPISGVLNSLTRPILTPIRRWVPIVNGFDFSSLVALILLQMFNISFVSYIENYLNSIF
ncbi:MAG: YggT family protein [Methylophilus sp.]